MSKTLAHAMEWKRALDVKVVTPKEAPEQELIDVVIGFERKNAWLELTREAMGLPDPYRSLVNGLSQYIPLPLAKETTVKLLAMVCAEDQGLEVSVELFDQNIKNMNRAL